MFCSSCGAAAPAGARFCTQCGVALAGIEVSAPAQTRESSPPIVTIKSEAALAPFELRLSVGLGDLLLVGSLTAIILVWLEYETEEAQWIFCMALWMIYWVACEASPLQATPVARMFRLRVADLNGSRAGFGRICWLNVCRLAQWLIFPPLGWLFAMVSPRNQTAANLFSGTLLLRRSADTSGLRAGLPPAITAGSMVGALLLSVACFGLLLPIVWFNIHPSDQVEILRGLGMLPPDEPLLSGSGGKP